jgi:hypothetical protein
MRKLYIAVALLFLPIAALAQTTTVHVQGGTLDSADIAGTITGSLTFSGPFSQMNITKWYLTIGGVSFTPSNSSYAGQISGSLLLRPALTVRAFYIFANDGTVLFLMVPDSFFRDTAALYDKVHIFPVGADVAGNSVMVYGSGLYHSSYLPVVQVTTATMRITKINP